PVVSLAAIEPRRLYEKNDDSHRVDEKTARIGQQVFPTGVEYAENQRSEQCSLQTAKAPDGHNDQEQNEIKHRKAWRETKQLNRKAAAESSETGADGESQREQAIDVDADRFSHTPVIDGGANLCANVRALECVPEDRDKHGAEDNKEGAVARKIA